MLMMDGERVPLAAFTTSANHAEVNTIETLIESRNLPRCLSACYMTVLPTPTGCAPACSALTLN
ncbi:hypothetical protein SH668x_000280 [Planctomicrobium sp. SH668]|uniref:hypothetical protein n=1 Tax=Planctomicrobium sp. SH668 TaxID=3448126 RepID=UPI003F5B8B85